MARTTTVIDITNIPELRRIVEEARATGAAGVLRIDDEDVAVLTPIGTDDRVERHGDDAEAEAAFLSSFGGWAGLVDSEQLKRDLKEARGSDRPLVVFPE